MAYNAYGIDLGTSNIKIYSNSDNSIMNERNMIAIEGREDLFAYGDSAYEMYEKAPSNIHISHPLTNGVIAEIHNMQTVLEHFSSAHRHVGLHFMQQRRRGGNLSGENPARCQWHHPLEGKNWRVGYGLPDQSWLFLLQCRSLPKRKGSRIQWGIQLRHIHEPWWKWHR